MKTTTTGSVHRFHNKTAIYIGNGETVYLDTKQALNLAKAINKCAKEIKNGVSFQNSKINTIDI